MSWLRFDQDMFEHPKFEQYADRPTLWTQAIALFAKSCAYASKQRDLRPQRVELHGLVPRSVIARLVPFKGADAVAERLCDVPRGFEFGLFERDGDDYRIHDFEDFAPPDIREIAAEIARAPLTGAERARRHREAKRNGAVTDRNETRDGERYESNGASHPLPRSPSPRDLDLGLEERETRVTNRDGRNGDPSVTPRDGVTEIRERTERLRAGYVTRFELERPGVNPDACAQPMSGGPWHALARLLRDEDVDKLLDAYFADTDPFVASDRSPTKIESQRVRLLTKGPTLAKTAGARRVEPASHDQVRERVEAQAGKGATHVRRDL